MEIYTITKSNFLGLGGRTSHVVESAYYHVGFRDWNQAFAWIIEHIQTVATTHASFHAIEVARKQTCQPLFFKDLKRDEWLRPSAKYPPNDGEEWEWSELDLIVATYGLGCKAIFKLDKMKVLDYF